CAYRDDFDDLTFVCSRRSRLLGSILFPYTTLFRSPRGRVHLARAQATARSGDDRLVAPSWSAHGFQRRVTRRLVIDMRSERPVRSEERRVGKECRARGWKSHEQKTNDELRQVRRIS